MAGEDDQLHEASVSEEVADSVSLSAGLTLKVPDAVSTRMSERMDIETLGTGSALPTTVTERLADRIPCEMATVNSYEDPAVMWPAGTATVDDIEVATSTLPVARVDLHARPAERQDQRKVKASPDPVAGSTLGAASKTMSAATFDVLSLPAMAALRAGICTLILMELLPTFDGSVSTKPSRLKV
jgi:hypothetical protein